jgi:hypothetical protein
MAQDPYEQAHFYGEEFALEERRAGKTEPGDPHEGDTTTVFFNVTGRYPDTEADRDLAASYATEWQDGYLDRWNIIQDELRDQQ